jgi:serine/threonine-protein kinase
MAPEQVDSEVGPVDGRADIYALGVMLHEMLTGRNPYAGRSVTEALMAHLREDVPRPSALRAEVPRELDEIVLKATRRPPDERYQVAAAMGEALAVFLKDSASGQHPALGPLAPPPRPARRRALPFVLAAVALLLGVAGVVAWRAGRGGPAGTTPTAAGAARTDGGASTSAAAARAPGSTGPVAAPASAPLATPHVTEAATRPASAVTSPVRATKAPRAAGARPRDGRRPRLPDAPTTTFKVPK